MQLKEIERLAGSLMEAHIEEPGWKFTWDNAKSRGGATRHSRKQISMSRHLVPLWTDEQVIDTLLHEIAHAMLPPSAGHGPEWRRTARSIGCSAERTHSNETAPAAWLGSCGCEGRVFERHRLSERVRNATCRRCEQALVWVRNSN